MKKQLQFIAALSVAMIGCASQAEARRGKAHPAPKAAPPAVEKAAPEAAAPAPVVNTPEADIARLSDAAKMCDEQAADAFSKIPGENADIVAAASFDKCGDQWHNIVKTAGKMVTDIKSIDPKEVKANIYLLPETLKKNEDIQNVYNIDAMRADEIKRLRIFVLEKRLQRLTPETRDSTP